MPISANTKRLAYILFSLSGASSLIYQMVWVRMLGLTFGTTIFAVSTVLTAFMAGLALGSICFGRLVDRGKDPLQLFAFLQLGIGVFALLFPFLLEALTHTYVSVHQQMPTSFYLRSLIRFGLSFLLLLAPTTLMGGTLPVLSKFFVRRLKELGHDVANLYSVNNLGAVLGCFSVGFFLIQSMGVEATIHIAAMVNFLIAAAILALRQHLKAHEPLRQDDDHNQDDPQIRSPQTYPRYVLSLVLFAFALEGFCALAYEVIWTRILIALADEKSVYFFTTVVITFIFGLSLGSLIVSKFIDHQSDLLALFAFIEIAIGLLAVWLLPVFAALPGLLAKGTPLHKVSWWLYPGGEFFIFFLVMLIPTTLMGTTLPIVSKMYAMNLSRLGSRLGNIGCLDTIGSIFGSFAAGFILIPFLGVAMALIVTASINIGLGALLLFLHPSLRYKAKLATGLILLAVTLATAGVIDTSGKSLRHWNTREAGDALLYYKEGPAATVAVPQSPVSKVKRLAINGAVTAFAAYGDVRVHRMLGYLPFLLQERPERALVIGLGMGITLQSLIQPGIHEADCVEISPEVVEAARHCFSTENHAVLDEPTVSVIVEDGRNHLLMTDKQYDIITSNAIHVRYSSNLYTRDFYRICKRRLTQSGVMCQWLPRNWLSEREYQMLLKSFMEVFPHTSLWCIYPNHTILVGTPTKFRIDLQSVARKLQAEKAVKDLGEVDLDSPFTFLTQFAANEDELAKYVAGVPPHTDNNPYVEFSRVADTGPNWSALRKISQMRIDQTIVFCGKALESDPTLQEARLRLGIAYNCKGMHDEALLHLEERVRVDPQAHEARYHIAAACVAKRMHTRAIAELEKAVKLKPDFMEARYALARLYREMGRYEEAERELEEVLRISPGFRPASFGLRDKGNVSGSAGQ